MDFFLQDIPTQVGTRRAKMGANSAFLPFLGEALVWALNQSIGDKMTKDARDAWNKVYDSMSEEIIKAILMA